MVVSFIGRKREYQEKTTDLSQVTDKLWPLGHVSYCHHFSSVVRCPSVNISHFNLLLRNHWANCNQTLVEWSLDGPLPKLCPVIPGGHHGWKSGSLDTTLEGGHPRTIPPKFGCNWPSGF
jgi:hypothetical protein